MTNEDSVEMEVTTDEYVYTTTVPEKIWLCGECGFIRVQKKDALCCACTFFIKYDDEKHDDDDHRDMDMHDDTY